MTDLKSNLLANFAGLGLPTLLQLALVPVYIRLMGIESYGLIGFYAMLLTMMQVLDLGLGTTMNREMARYSTQSDMGDEARDFVRTLELVYWPLGIIAGGIVVAMAPLIATRWINPGTLPVPVVKTAIVIMGGLAAAQFPITLYQGGLLGLQRQVLLNSVRVVGAVIGNGGAALILWLVSPTITAFLCWQLAVSSIQAVVLAVCLRRSLPPADRTPRFSSALLRNVRRFAAGMSGITVSSLILSQVDKVILSKMLSLEMFGYYSLAVVVGNGLLILVTPVFNTVFPRFTFFSATGDENGLRELYHLGSQLMAVVIVPAALVVSMFAYELVFLWTGSPETAAHVSPIVRIIVIGTALNGMMHLPNALQLAHGWTRIGLSINTLLIVTLVPVIVVLTSRYGATGGAAAWVILNGVSMMIGVPLTHRRLLKGDARRWYLTDLMVPAAGALLVVAVGRSLASRSTEPLVSIFTICLLSAVSMAAAAMAAPQTRAWIIDRTRLLFERIQG
jgi:O-antigen/teichoic acid export membrane protein